MMDRQALTSAMKASISDVLETMFFMPLDFVTAGADTEAEPMDGITVSLAFSGPAAGCFALQIPEPLARDISADFLGVGPDQVGADEMTGTVKEMVNMLAGNTLSLYDADVVFDLGVPEMEAGNALPTVDPDVGKMIRLDIQTMGSRITLALRMA